MLIALLAHDKPGALSVRQGTRADHLAYIEATGVVQQAGPILDDGGDMVGSLIILDVADMDAARDWAANDPYAKADLFAEVKLLPWKRVIG
ncbi:MAG: YciI family protein [Marinovum sp.]|nr:YciI family protein [Marinovum sp.]